MPCLQLRELHVVWLEAQAQRFSNLSNTPHVALCLKKEGSKKYIVESLTGMLTSRV